VALDSRLPGSQIFQGAESEPADRLDSLPRSRVGAGAESGAAAPGAGCFYIILTAYAVDNLFQNNWFTHECIQARKRRVIFLTNMLWSCTIYFPNILVTKASVLNFLNAVSFRDLIQALRHIQMRTVSSFISRLFGGSKSGPPEKKRSIGTPVALIAK